MQKIFKSVFSLCLAVAVCLSTAAFAGAARYTVADADAGTYYGKITATGGTQLLGQLHDLIVDTHKTYTTYDDCKKYGPTTDPGLDGKGVMEFYTHETIMNFVGGVGDWNREHVWCQSLSNGLWGTSGGGSDLHHIRPSESGLNSIRGNNKYGEVSGGKEAWSRLNGGANSKLGGYISGSTFEPLDNVKGDVARIVMYVYTHYNKASNVGGTKESAKTYGNLPFTNVITANSEAAAKKLLLEWNALDPVDEIERFRNEAVYKIQGNRNPFIDCSDYANAIWGDGTVVDPPVNPDPGPSDTLQSISLSATALTLTLGQTYDLTVTPTPGNASASVLWSTSDSSVVTVSNGKITANAAGTATITATSTVNTSIKATATVTVKHTSSPAATGKITITRDSFTDPTGGYGFQTWTANGVEGTAFIYGGTKDSMQFTNKQQSYYIASTSGASGPITSVTVKSASGKTDRDWKLLTSDIPYGELTDDNPANGNDRGTKTVTTDGVTWNLSGNDKYFALVYALQGATGAGYLDSIVVEYGSSSGNDELQELFINPSGFTLKEGGSAKLTAASVPSTASAEVSWTSSDPSVATVSADGTVTAVKAGTATITATSAVKPTVKATATVTVTAETAVSGNERVQAFHKAVTEISLDATPAALFTSINKALSLYKDLSAAEIKTAATDVEILKSSITYYYNLTADEVDETALNCIGG